MSAPFQFKAFRITQDVNSQKVGTDSMLLGAWSSGSFNTILDVGTGTGILALMLAQMNPAAKIVAIEHERSFLEEASENFSNSTFANRICPVHARLQSFRTADKYDLVISNPPYFENSSRSQNEAKNAVRHTESLPISELYKSVKSLLNASGYFNVIFPYELEERHFSEANAAGLYPHRILRTLRDDKVFKRTLVSFSFEKVKPIEQEMIVKFSDNSYSKEYIEMTKSFYEKDLSNLAKQTKLP